MKNKTISIAVIITVLMISSVLGNAVNVEKNSTERNSVYNFPIKDVVKLPLFDRDQEDQQNTHQADPAVGLMIYEDRKGAQSFKPTLNVLTRVKLLIWGIGIDEDVIVSIRSSLSGSDLTNVSVPPEEVPSDPAEWVEFNFPDISVTPESSYYIVMESETQYPGHYVWMLDDQDTYQRGDGWAWNPSEGWHKLEDFSEYYDLCFKTYGYDNNPPYTPSNPSPYDGATNVDVNADLSWDCSDPNGDPLTYDVYFGTSSSPPKVVSNQSETTYDPGTMDFEEIYFWKIVAWDDHGHSTSGPIWDFITIPEYLTADADGPYYSFTGYYVQFQGSAYGGNPPYSYHWSFGDGHSSNEQNIKHTYSSPDTYTATLTVTDYSGGSDTDIASVEIKNLPEVVQALLILSPNVKPSWDGAHLNATIPFNVNSVTNLIDVDGSVPGDVDIDTFDGPYDFFIKWDDTKITIDLYPKTPDNDKMELTSGVELTIDTFEVFKGEGNFKCGADASFTKIGDEFEWDLTAYLRGSLEFPVFRFYSAIILPPFVIPISVKVDFSLGGDVTFKLNSPTGLFDDNVFSSVNGSLSAGGSFHGGVGFVDVLSGGVYGGLTGSWYFKAPEENGSLYDSFTLTASGGLYAEIIYLGYWEFELVSDSWPDVIKGNTSNNGYHFIPRDYDNPTWVNNDEGILIDDAFPLSNPSISSNSNNDKIMVWAEDDLNKGDKGDGLDLWFSTWNKNTEKWNDRQRLIDDNLAQSNPSVTLFDNGDAICVFNCLTESASGKTVEETFEESEIGYCYWDGNEWSELQLIVPPDGTTNYYMDSFPVIKSDGNQAFVVWLCDDDADILTVDDKSLYTSFWDGSSWGNTRILLNQDIITAPVSLVVKNDQAACAYSVDEDGSLSTPNDQNIYVTTFSNTIRNDNTFQITNSGRNARPSVNFIEGSNPSVSWAIEQNTTDDLYVDIVYKHNINSRDPPEEVETGLNTVSSAPLISISSTLKRENIPLVGWSEEGNICFKKRFDGVWEDKQLLHLSNETITQTAWDYNGTGEDVYAVFVEKEDLNTRQDCQLRIAGKGQMLTPDPPWEPEGPTKGYINDKYDFSTYTKDPTPLDNLWYNFSWGDGSYSNWLGPYKSKEPCISNHRWESLGTFDIKVKARNKYRVSDWSDPLTIKIISHPPGKPAINGPQGGAAGQTYEYTFQSWDIEEDDIEYYIDWGDGQTDGWWGPYETGYMLTLEHKWYERGTYTIKAKAKDSINQEESDWSYFKVSMPRNRKVIGPVTFESLQDLLKKFPILEKCSLNCYQKLEFIQNYIRGGMYHEK